MSVGAPRLELLRISKSFPNARVLNDVSIAAHPGEVLALMGENGAGKSTLLKIMTGAYSPDHGQIRVDGSPISFPSPQASRRLGIRVVYQEPDIIAETTVAENLFVGELPKRWGNIVDWKTLNRNAEELLSSFRFGRTLRPTTLARKLSPAQRQMIEILRALRGDLRVLALDEPTSSLSDAEAEDLFAVLAGMKARGIALIYVSHRMREILRLADRVAVLRDGVLVGTRPAGELDSVTLIRMMVGRSLSEGMRRSRHVSETPILTVSRLSSPGVHDIDLTVHRGEVVGLAGLVGAGRTEVAKTIFGAIPSDSGHIAIDGMPVSVRSPRDAISAGIAYVPEERKADALLLERSVLENMSLTILRRLTRFRIIDQRRERKIVAEFMDRMRVKAPSAAVSIGTLSGGNQQKVVLARWLAMNPKVMILDEPTRGIDVGAKSEIYDLIDSLASSGMGVILISSELPEILGLADRIVCMQHGRITGSLDAGAATEESVLSLCMTSEMMSAEPD
jgi:L-arabinose transport system ATP-binding protein